MPLHTRDREPATIVLQALSHWWKRWSRSKFTSHHARGTNGVSEIKMTVKSTWHQKDHVSWPLGLCSKHHLLEVGLTQNQETMALRNLTTVDSFYSIMCEDPTRIESH
jgi:hypothetical protein